MNMDEVTLDDDIEGVLLQMWENRADLTTPALRTLQNILGKKRRARDLAIYNAIVSNPEFSAWFDRQPLLSSRSATTWMASKLS